MSRKIFLKKKTFAPFTEASWLAPLYFEEEAMMLFTYVSSRSVFQIDEKFTGLPFPSYMVESLLELIPVLRHGVGVGVGDEGGGGGVGGGLGAHTKLNNK